MSKKKVVKKEHTFVVVDADGIQEQADDFIDAQELAAKCLDDGSQDVKILEVVKAWYVEYPEELQPEVHELDLEGVT